MADRFLIKNEPLTAGTWFSKIAPIKTSLHCLHPGTRLELSQHSSVQMARTVKKKKKYTDSLVVINTSETGRAVMRAAVWGGSIRPPLPRQLPCHRRVNLFADRTATGKESQLVCWLSSLLALHNWDLSTRS